MSLLSIFYLSMERSRDMQENPQFVRTDKAIKQALIALLKTKPFEKITVQDILDETPVTRSTFYKHYHDKYEIAEKMQDDFFESQMALRKAVHENPNSTTTSLLKITQHNHELMNALLKIHTENVDLRQALANQSIEYYLNGVTGAHPEIEAEIFAQAVTAFQLASPEHDTFAFEYMHDIFICVMLRLIGAADDDELRKLLKKKSVSKLAPPQ